MPKGAPVLRTPVKSSKVLSSAKKTHRRVRKKPRLKIIPPRHIGKDIWARLSLEELDQAKQKQRTIARDKTFRVPSTSASDKTYDVVCDSEGAWTCTCPDFVYRSAANQSRYGFYCKHVSDCIDKVLAAQRMAVSGASNR